MKMNSFWEHNNLSITSPTHRVLCTPTGAAHCSVHVRTLFDGQGRLQGHARHSPPSHLPPIHYSTLHPPAGQLVILSAVVWVFRGMI